MEIMISGQANVWRMQTNAQYGYFLDQDIALFDNEFFRISGKEAESMDPQQRLLLEVTYEALENAGIPFESLQGSKTGVYVGSFSNDYNSSMSKDFAHYPQHTVTGLGNSILANRISYFYGLHGPSITIDTACSSSLVCFHLGAQSLRSGESDLVIVAGSALHFDPNTFITMTDFEMLSASGRCRTFDSQASGYVRGEGICAVVLKRQCDAEEAGDRIDAVVRATAINHDGMKDGLTLPNGEAQAKLLREIYSEAGLDPVDTQYFEVGHPKSVFHNPSLTMPQSHGTGTARGDPIEAAAIGAVFGKIREQPLIIGSIKSNVGHLEGASGLAGIIKTTLCINSAKILPNMHFNTPNPHIDFENWNITVPTELHEWPHGPNHTRRASVNSFGYGGTNAHVILENYTPRDLRASTNRLQCQNKRPFLLPWTAHTTATGKLLVSRFYTYLEQSPKVEMSDLAYTLGTRRSIHLYRSFTIATDIVSAKKSIAQLEANAWTRSQDTSPKIGFIFTGQGAQWPNMGRDLIELSPFFRQTLEHCDAVLSKLPDRPDWTCVAELLKPAGESLLGQSKIFQPLCVAVQLAIVDLLRAWGITPTAVVGHSSGEIAAAYAAGILPFESAIICGYYRGLYMSKGLGAGSDSPRGAMMAVGMAEADMKDELAKYAGSICLAAINSTTSMTVSGDADAIHDFKKSLDKRGVFARLLRVEQAFHSHHMLPLAPGFREALTTCPEFRSSDLPPNCQMYSSVTARDVRVGKLDAAYWATNMTGMVRFADALTGILLDEHEEQNIDVLIEIGPHPALKMPSTEIMESLNIDIPYLGTLSRKEPDLNSLLSTAGQLFNLGHPVHLETVNSDLSRGIDGQVIPVAAGSRLENLPTYTWDHRRFWSETRVIREHRYRQARHTLLGFPVPGAPAKYERWRNYLRLSEIPWLSQHVIDGKNIFPAAGYISLAIQATAISSQRVKRFHLRDISFKTPLVLNETETGTEIVTELAPLALSAKNYASATKRFVVFSFDANGITTEHCHGLITVDEGPPASAGTLDLNSGFFQHRKATNCRRPQATYYRRLHNQGLAYGKDFQLLSDDIESGEGFSLAPLEFTPKNVISHPVDSCVLHPTILDASLHAVYAAIESIAGKPAFQTFVPTFLRTMTVSGQAKQPSSDPQHYWVRSKTARPGARVAMSNVSIQLDRSNDMFVNMEGFEMTTVGDTGSGPMKDSRPLFFQMKWNPAFDQLGGSNIMDRFSSMADLMDCYVHQYPNAKILHITEDFGKTKDILSHLGSTAGVPRRFQSLTVRSPSGEHFSDHKKQEATGLSDLLNFEVPQSEKYDIVIVNDRTDTDIPSLLASNGFAITGNESVSLTGLESVCRGMRYGLWRTRKSLAANANHTSETITLILSDKCGHKTKSLILLIDQFHRGDVQIVSMTEARRSPSKICRNVISLVSLDEDILLDPSKEEFESVQTLFTNRVAKNIVLITKDLCGDDINPAQALVQGLLRAVQSETEHLRLVSFNVSSKYETENVARQALAMLDRRLSESEFGQKDGFLTVPRVEVDNVLNEKVPGCARDKIPRLEPFSNPDGPRNLALKIDKTGLLDTLAFDEDEDITESQLADDDIEVEVKASALNFRDIAAAMGLIHDYRLGDECSGIVRQTGRNVRLEDFQPGDRVVAIRPGQGSHRALVRNPALLCLKIDSTVDLVNATAFPAILMTAYYSLIEVGRLQKGDYCLIHSAAGGVGQMAIQLAQRAGANVIVTVGSQDKREFVRKRFSIPNKMILSSRDKSFTKGVMKITSGRGCDLVLNSLAGDLLHETWKCIAPFGRMMEIGKRDIHENTKLDMEPFRRNVTYSSVDLITMLHHSPARLANLFRVCYDLILNGEIALPDPIRVFSYAEAQQAFRTLQFGKQFGKVVLVPYKDDMVPVLPASFRNGTQLFKPEKCYLLVGGLGGIGRPMAEWMLRRGARRFAFLSRSGAESLQAQKALEWLTSRNAQVAVFRGDVTNYDTVSECIEALGDTLGGIFQASMVLRDVPFAQMTAEQWRECILPKVRGTFNLHQATLDHELDFFVSFSSSSAIIGALGQANYAAANCYIDAMMQHRRQQGLAGTTMNIGVVGDIGVAAENTYLEKILDQLGYGTIGEDGLFYQVENAVTESLPSCGKTVLAGVEGHRTITGINMSRKDLYWCSKPLVRNLYANLDLQKPSHTPGRQDFTTQLRRTASFEKRSSMLMTAFLEKVAAVLGSPVTGIQPENPLSAYGLDSIVAVEFRKWLYQITDVDVPLFDMMGAKSINALVERVNTSMAANVDDSTEVKVTSDNHSLGSQEAGITASVLLQHQTHHEDTNATEFQVITRPDRIPLSTFQRRIWASHRAVENPATLNLAIQCKLKGHVDLENLRGAFEALTQRNDILRTAYSDRGGRSEQHAIEGLVPQIHYLDLSYDGEPNAAFERCVNSLKSVSLNLERGEVMRATLAKLGEELYGLALIVHHIAIDNSSSGSFFRQIITFYDALRGNQTIELIQGPLVPSYAAFALWQEEQLRSAKAEGDIQWWMKQLEDVQLTTSKLLPFPKNEGSGDERCLLIQTLDSRHLSRMKRLASSSGATTFHFLLAAVWGYLHRYTQKSDLTLLIVDGNRPHPALDDTIGYFVNLLPLRRHGNCHNLESFYELVQQMRSLALDVLSHSQVPLETITESIAASRGMASKYTPLSQVVVNYQVTNRAPRLRTADFEVGDVAVDDMRGTCELAIEAREDPVNGLQLRLDYDASRYPSDYMMVFWQGFVEFLRLTIKDHHQGIDEIDGPIPSCDCKQYMPSVVGESSDGGDGGSNNSSISSGIRTPSECETR